MERKGNAIPLDPNALMDVGNIMRINELLSVFGRIQNATDGQALVFDSTVGEFLPETLSTGLAAFSKKIGSFTIDTSTATGTQAVTGVGFQPQLILFLACQDTTDEVSVGFDDGTNKGSVGFYNGNWYISTSYSISDLEAVGVTPATYYGVVSALGADGFTVSWTKTGSPTGTLTVLYLALRIA